MITRAFYDYPRMLLLAILVIAAAGAAAFVALPRMEDPVLGKRVGLVITALPGAAAERVESLVTEPLEDSLRGVAEVEQLSSLSRAGFSSIVVELRDEVTAVDPVWSHVRDRVDEAARDLPGGALPPSLEVLPLKANAAIFALRWRGQGEANFAILGRLADELKLEIRALDGTEAVDLQGLPEELVSVEISRSRLSRLGLTIGEVAQQLRDSDAKQPAGVLRGSRTDLVLDLGAEAESLNRLGRLPIRYGGEGNVVALSEIAAIRKTVAEPPEQLALVDGEPAVMVSAHVRDSARIDWWSARLMDAVGRFQQQLPAEIQCETIFSQSDYVERRLDSLTSNLELGTAAVVLVIFLLMGWRSTLVMATMLPLSALMVLAGMRLLGIPIHQMSVTGLIIALGLLIDNVIVMVDEVRSRIWGGMPRLEAVQQAVGHLALPLFGSTLTTTLAFAPIALLPGAPGEFVGTLAVSVILAINSSFLLAMTLVPAMTALLQPAARSSTHRKTLFRYGLTSRTLTAWYERSLEIVFRFPLAGVLLGAALPALGFLAARSLPEQFFPPTDRNQLQVEIELSAGSTLAATREVAESMRSEILADEGVARVHWFLGRSAPTFYYNLVPRRRNAPQYGQALVELQPRADAAQVARRLQRRLPPGHGEARVVVRQLEQGPPFDAPVEVRVTGPNLATLQRVGGELRRHLSEIPQVVATRSDLEETLSKLAVDVDLEQAERARLSHGELSRQLFTSLEGLDGGALLDGPRQLPIRVRLAETRGMAPDDLGALQIVSPPRRGPPPQGRGPQQAPAPVAPGPPLEAIAQLRLDAEVAAIPRINGQRCNEVKAYLTPGTLPAGVIAELEQRLVDTGFQLPPGCQLSYGGEAAQRDEAVTNLLANGAVLFTLMLVTLVLSFQSFRIALIITVVGGLSIGLGAGSLWTAGHPFGFMAILGTMGLVGVAINDAIVVMAAVRGDPRAARGDVEAIRRVVVGATRHVVATTLTTVVGFIPLLVNGGQFWPPLAVTIAGGVGGATLLALYLVPSLYLMLAGRRVRQPQSETSRIAAAEAGGAILESERQLDA